MSGFQLEYRVEWEVFTLMADLNPSLQLDAESHLL
jgi:hypothetical protein